MMRLVAVQRWPVVPKRAPQPAFDGEFEIGVVEHDHGILAAEFERAMLEALGRGCADDRADRRSIRLAKSRGPSGCSVSGVPTSEPKPVTILMTPLGTPASVRACTRLKVESGVSCAGLMTQVLPQTIAGSSFHEEMAMGKFHGVIMPQTPMRLANGHGKFVGQLGGNGWAEHAAAFAGVVVGGVDGFLHVAASFVRAPCPFRGSCRGRILLCAR